jgi:hypothetical protein
MRGSSDDDQLRSLRLHHVHRPGDGTSGSKGSSSARSAIHIPPLSKPIEICLEGHGGIFCATSRAVIPPKPHSGLRYRRKGVDGEDIGRGTIGVAMIGCDHAWAASVLVHRKVDPLIHIRCRITASLRATATLARLRPRRLATSNAQRLSAEKRVTRESKTFAAS